MATPNIVPRADSEGGLGTSSKYWAAAYIDTITTTSHIKIPDLAELKIGTGDDLKLRHNGTDSFITNTTGGLTIDNQSNDENIVFKGKDNNSTITALTLDMSEAGLATFNDGIVIGSGTSIRRSVESNYLGL